MTSDKNLIEAMSAAYLEASECAPMDVAKFVSFAGMRAALAVVRREERWRPIASAPKAWEPLGGGSSIARRILLANEHGSMFLGHWSNPNGSDDGYWSDTSTGRQTFSMPTRWRPITPPDTDAGGRDD